MAINIEVQAQLNALIANQNKLLQETAELSKTQLNITRELVNAMKSIDFKGMATDVQTTQKAVQNAANATQNYGNVNQNVFDKVSKTLKEAVKSEEGIAQGMSKIEQQAKKFKVATSAIDGFIQGLRMTYNTMHGIVSLGSGLVGTLGHIGASIVSIPFKMLSGLIHMSDQGGGSNELQQALEDIRKEFGTLKKDSGGAIVSMARTMKGELANTGLSVYRIFGNLAERLKTMQEYAHNLGPLFANLADQFASNAEAIGAYYKGLGLTEEGQQAVAQQAKALGTSVTEGLRQIANYSIQMSSAFNGTAGSAKEISRDMGKLMADFKHFGGISTKEIAQATVYFRRLGIEVTKVLGVIDKYDNFEDAATGAAHLSQAFNLNVDALELMKAQNPAQRVDMLRKSFFQAGRSVEGMTRQERALLAQQTGLEDSTLDLVFSMKNQGMTYDQVTRKADVAKKKQLSQTEAMTKLADSIERLVKSGSGMGSGGFIDRFIQGFTVGIQRSQEFRQIMRNLRIDLMAAYRAGIQVGKAFVDMFPGVKEVFKGIADLFQPAKFRAMLGKIVGTFKDFFKNLTSDPKTAPKKLLDSLKENFFSWFQGNSQNGQKILDGFKKFFLSLSSIAGGLLKVALKGITTGVSYITDLLTGKKHLGELSGGKGALGFIGQFLNPIIEAIKENGPELFKALKGMITALWTKVQPWLKDNWFRIVSIAFGPAAVGVLSRTVITALATGVFSGVGSWLKTGFSKGFDSIKGLLSQKVNDITKQAAKLATPPPGAAQAASTAGNVAAQATQGAEQAAQVASKSRITMKDIGKMALIGTFIAVGMAAMLYGVFRFAKAMKDNRLGPAEVGAAAGVMITIAGSMFIIASSIKLLSAINLNPAMGVRIAAGIAIIGVVGAAMAFGARGLVSMFGDYPAEKLAKTGAMMGATGAFFIAAAGVTAIAAGIGALALSAGGVGALMVGAGLAAISGTIAIMVTQGLAIMRSIDQFRPGPGFVEKARVFVEVMKGVGSFAASIASLVAATRPGILDFLRLAGAEEQRMTLRQVENTITVMGGQIVGIVNALKTNIQQLSGSERELRGAEVLGNLLTGVGDLANALKPPAEVIQSPGFWASISGDNISRRISLITDFVNEMGTQLRAFVGTIARIITSDLSGGITENQKRAAEVIPALLGGVGQVAQALRPSAGLLQEMNRGADFAGQVTHISRFVRNTVATIDQSQLFQKIGDLLRSITESVRGMTPQQIKGVEAIAPIVGPAIQSVVSIANIIGSLAVPSQGSTAGNATAIANLTSLVNVFFERAARDIPALITNMREAFRGMTVNEASSLSKSVEAVSKVFEVVTNIPRMLANLKGFAGGDAANAIVGLPDINHFLNTLLLLLKGTGSNFGLANIIGSVAIKLDEITSHISNPGAFVQKIGALKTIFEVLGSIPNVISEFARVAGSSTGIVSAQVLDVPLMNLNNIITSLSSPGTSNGPNLLVGGRLTRALSGVTGISNQQKSLILGITERVSEVTRSLASLTAASIPNAAQGISQAMSNANASLYALAEQMVPGLEGNLYANITNFAPLAREMTAKIGTAAISDIGNVVRDMINQVNLISQEIRSITPISIETSLENLGANLGLGKNGKYTIENRNFTINVPITIKFDNAAIDQFELAMLRRNGPHPTRIQHGDLTQ